MTTKTVVLLDTTPGLHWTVPADWNGVTGIFVFCFAGGQAGVTPDATGFVAGMSGTSGEAANSTLTGVSIGDTLDYQVAAVSVAANPGPTVITPNATTGRPTWTPGNDTWMKYPNGTILARARGGQSTSTFVGNNGGNPAPLAVTWPGSYRAYTGFSASPPDQYIVTWADSSYGGCGAPGDAYHLFPTLPDSGRGAMLSGANGTVNSNNPNGGSGGASLVRVGGPGGTDPDVAGQRDATGGSSLTPVSTPGTTATLGGDGAQGGITSGDINGANGPDGGADFVDTASPSTTCGPGGGGGGGGGSCGIEFFCGIHGPNLPANNTHKGDTLSQFGSAVVLTGSAVGGDGGNGGRYGAGGGGGGQSVQLTQGGVGKGGNGAQGAIVIQYQTGAAPPPSSGTRRFVATPGPYGRTRL